MSSCNIIIKNKLYFFLVKYIIFCSITILGWTIIVGPFVWAYLQIMTQFVTEF